MSQPLVCCVMLVNRRPEMVRRAVESFRAQTYERKRLYVYDTGTIPCTNGLLDGFPGFNIVYHRGLNKGEPIGSLRNIANWWGVRPSSVAEPDADIIAHWDSDDWSHPNRLTEQVALLQSSGADAVGYDEMVFWQERQQQSWLYSQRLPGIHAVAVGSSLLYWRGTWHQKPFRDTSSGEDLHFCSGLRVTSVSSLHQDGEPRMICSIHGANTASAIDPKAREWRRAPEFDQYCRKAMTYAREDSNAAVPSQS